MEKEIKTSVPGVYLEDLERIVNKIKETSIDPNPEITFAFIIGSLFPMSWQKIQADLSYHYTQGCIQGRKDEQEECRAKRIADEDPDCYCE